MMNIMKRAWEIAKEGQEKFGGKVSEYLSESMKIAWNEWKNFNENIKQLKELNAEAERITRKPMANMDFDNVLEKAKNENGERYNRELNNINTLVNNMSTKMDNNKLINK